MTALPSGFHVGVVGGGIAGLAAATVLAERGARVTLCEAQHHLGGRAGSWPDRLCDGTPFEMERGFHAFFRQYYNLRSLLRRVDPELSRLVPAGDYPVLGPHGERQSFAGLPRSAPWNLAALTWRSPYLGLRDLGAIDRRKALAMVGFDRDRTYARWDDVTAADYLDALNFPAPARRMLFDVFAHSFFNPEDEMSAGELLMMFHFYFVANPEGLAFDLCRQPFSRAFFRPLGAYLEARGATIRTGCRTLAITARAGGGHVIETSSDAIGCEALVLATSVPELRAIVDASPALSPALGPGTARLGVARPFAVLRVWLDRATAPGRAPFVGTTGVGRLDNISLYHLYEEDARAWAARTGGAVVELHAYAVAPDDVATPEGRAALRAELVEALHGFYPETRGARVVDERFLVMADCPSFAPGSHAARPCVATSLPDVALAGDFVRLPFPSALMERAAASGFLAASHVLAPFGVAAEPVRSIAARGLLAGWAS